MHAVPQALTRAATDIAGIGSEISTANASAALPTTAVLAAAGDEVSAQVAALFSGHARGYQQLSEQMSAFHDTFVRALASTAGSYATTEANAARTLANAVNAPVADLLGHSSVVAPAGGLVAKAAAQVQALFSGAGGPSALALTPTGGTGALAAAANSLLRPAAGAAAGPAAVLPVSWAAAIENAYLTFEPYVAYGFELVQYAAYWLPYVGILAPQISFLYDLIEPMVQSGLFNTLDWLSGTISFGQGLSNFFATTSASINQFINTEIYWFLSFFPPLPPLPPILVP